LTYSEFLVTNYLTSMLATRTFADLWLMALEASEAIQSCYEIPEHLLIHQAWEFLEFPRDNIQLLVTWNRRD
jgi:hypothetical protein